MKKTFFTLAISLIATTGFAQWNQNGNNISTANNVGIGTATPQYKLDVNGDMRTDKLILKNINPPGSPTMLSRIYYGGHDLIIGSAEGSWANNSFLLRPGGASQGLLSTTFIMENALNIGQYQRKVLIQSNGVSYLNGGNVGIGTENPQYKLDVNGSLYLNSSGGTAGWNETYLYYRGHSLVIGSPRGNYAHNVIEIKPRGASQGSLFSMLNMYYTPTLDNYQKKVQIHTAGISFFNGGNVGIGTENPQNKLDVNGTIRAKEVKVELDNWSDFVFDKDYKLPSLQEVETHINEHKHLPDIPSEKQVKEEGINLAEMQAKLLQKIEELTLYVIKQDKEIQDLKKALSDKK